MSTKIKSISEAVSFIANGDTVVLGGGSLNRSPVALIFETIRQEKQNLHLIGINSGMGMDILIGAGAAEKVETSSITMPGNSYSVNSKEKVAKSEVEVVYRPEKVLLDMFRAGSLGLTFIPGRIQAGSADHNQLVECPFTGKTYEAVRGIEPDVAIIHAHVADKWGNVLLDERHYSKDQAELYMGRAAKRLIVSVEQIVSHEYVSHNPHLNYLPGDAVTAVVEAPYGAYLCSCDTCYNHDMEFINSYYDVTKSEKAFLCFLQEWVYETADHHEFLSKVGLERVFEIQKAT